MTGFPQGRQHTRSIDMKIAYTVFTGFLLVGIVSLLCIEFYSIGFSYEKIVTHYLGSNLEDEMAFPMPLGQMLQQTHFHSLVVGMVLLVVVHMLAQTSIPVKTARMLGLTLFITAAVDIVSPWLIRYVSPLFAVLQLVSWPLFAACFLSSLLIIQRELWSS